MSREDTGAPPRGMIHVKVDVNFREHPKFLAAGYDGVGMWLRGLAYSREYTLDGRVPKIAVEAFPGERAVKQRLVKKLLEVGLWIDDGDGYVILNYAEKGNQTRAQIEESKRRDRERKRVGKGRGFHSEGDGTPSGFQSDSDRNPRAFPVSVSLSGSGDKDRVEREGDPGGGDERPSEVRQRAAYMAPDDIAVTGDLEAWAFTAGAPKPTREHVVAFLTNARAKGKIFADWTEGFKLWMIRQKSFDSAARMRSAPSMQPLAPARAKSEFTAAEAIAEGERQIREGVI